MKRFALASLLILMAITLKPLVAQTNSTTFDLASALNRVPAQTWDTISFTDFTQTMTRLGEEQILAGELSPLQLAAWEGVWQPTLFSQDVTLLGFSPYEIERAVEARRGGTFILWLEGRFDLPRMVAALLALGYEPLTDFPTEAYQLSQAGEWQRVAPYISFPNGNTLLIASTSTELQALVDVYDGLADPILSQDAMLGWVGEVSPDMTSATVRFELQTGDCPAQGSRLVVHGLRYNPELAMWEYLLTLGYPNEILVTNLTPLSNGLEFSTYPTTNYGGVLGQQTTILSQNLYENRNLGSLIQFVTALRPSFEALPFDLQTQRDPCELFAMPAANAPSLFLAFLPDLSSGRVDITLRYGNAEQALYNAGLDTPLSSPEQFLNERQKIALNGTWRTDLAYDTQFVEWFGFTPLQIRQAAELTIPSGEYTRVVWGDFTVAEVEAALGETGYVAVEQYNGVRVFTLRDVPEQGGFLLDSLTRTAAIPRDGVLVFTNQVVNMRLTLDVLQGTFQTSLSRTRELVLTAQALRDATNVTFRRYWNPLSGGLVCGLPPYKTLALANVQRPDGWYFLYAVGFSSELPEADQLAQALGQALDESDYPLQGPGSQTFGDFTTLSQTQALIQNSTTVLLAELKVAGDNHTASFLGQDLIQSNLPPCVLGEVSG